MMTMTQPTRIWDPIAGADTPELFREYLERCCGKEELARWVMRHMELSSVGMTECVHAIMEEAVSYLSQGELVEQVMLNEHERRRCPGYRRWCARAIEAEREREAREGVAY